MKRINFIVLGIVLSACGSEDNSTSQTSPPSSLEPLISIPIVFHVMYPAEYAEYNIPASKITSQMLALNAAFRAENSDLSNVPDEFAPYIADTQIEFHLASTDPDGNETSGITRTAIETFPDTDKPFPEYLYYDALNGKDAWPTDRYLNVWVYPSINRNGGLGFPGKAALPGQAPSEEDGIGHWLGLKHMGGDRIEDNITVVDCTTDDDVLDTPNSAHNYNSQLNPTHPSSTCGSNDMFMNYMSTVSNDKHLLMFTQGQKEKMWETLNMGGERHLLLQQHQDSN